MSGSKISGTVFLDQNADGTIETGDNGVGGVTVGLYTSAGAFVESVTTANDGTYAFTGLAAGTYYVQVSAPSGDSFSPTGTSASLPNSVVGSTGQTQTITITAADVANQTAIANIDAGVYVPVSVSGTVFSDANGDGLVDGTDQGIAGVTVQLLNAQGQPTGATTTTNANGAYTFANLAPGTYSVHVVMPTSEPAGAVFSPLGSNTPPQPTNGTVNQEQNLLVNGSFDNGEPTNAVGTTSAGLAGWTVSANTASTPYGSGPGNGPEIDWTNGGQNVAIDPTGALNGFAGTVSPDNANPALAGGSGTHAAFFVDDGAIETLSQTVSLTAGQVYEVGFDLDETIPGTYNPGFFQLSVTIGSVTIVTASSTSGTKLTPGVWTHFADLYTPTVSGPVTLTFAYESGVLGTTELAKDVLVDDVYVVPGQITPNLTTTSEVSTAGTTGQLTLTSGQTIGDESAGIYLPPGTISGTVFTDRNADGAQESGDAGIAGETIELISAGTIVATTTTSASGAYSFTAPSVGSYTVQVQQPSGTVFSPAGTSATLTDSNVGASGAATVTVVNGGASIVNAGLYTPGTISGTVFNDLNADGTQESGDAGLSGQTVNLLNASGTTIATTTTDANGAYGFTGVTPGADTVRFVAKSGDNFTTPSSTAVTVTSGSASTVNAGEYAPSTISGTVFNDVNADGTQESGDAGLSGQTVNLVNSTGAIIATTATGATGAYSFTGVAPGADTVQFITTSSDNFSTPSSDAVTVTSGSASTANAGEYAPSTISGTVFNDLNADGTQEIGDTGLSGQTVNLLNASGTTIATTTTGTNGAYSFAGVAPGADTVQFVAKAGDTFSTPGSDAVTVTSGSVSTANAGEYAPSTISGTVFNDLKADGTQESGDAGLSGQTVNLLNASGTTIATTTTGTNGAYSFTGVAPGADTVRFVANSGDTFSTPSSDAVTVTSGSASTVNAGEYAPSTISGTVFNDLNADGTQENGDTGLSGQTVNLLNSSGTTIATATTGTNGAYSFTGIAPGADTVRFVAKSGDNFSTPSSDAVTVTSGSASTANAGEYAPATISGTVFNDVNADGTQEAGDTGLAGQTVNLLAADGTTILATTTTGANGTYSFGAVTPGSDTVQFVANPGDMFSTLASDPVTVVSGGSATVNAGEYAPGTISGTVYNDVNADGTQELGDAGLSGQTVNLIAANGTTVIATTITNVSGGYSFVDVKPANDTVQFVAKTGDTFSTPAAVPVTVAEGSITTVNAGEFGPGTIGGTVFNDLNADGVQDGGDAGLSGQTVNLLNASGATIATTVTGTNGAYSFSGVAPGADTVQFVAKSGDIFTTASSDAVTVSSNSTATVNAGEYAPSTIGGTIFTDTNGDGIQDGGETGLGGQTVTLRGVGGGVIATTTTNASGAYSFTGVAPGADTIQFTAAPGDAFSTAGVVPVSVTSGSATTVNAGEYAPATITGTVFNDINGDGIQDGGDSGLLGQTVNLLGANGQVIATTTTGAGGGYSFGDLAPGADTVQFIAAPGDTLSTAGQVPVTVTSGGGATVNAGEYAGGTIVGTVFNDLNANGARDGGDNGLSGQTVELLGSNGQIIAATTTGAGGGYGFGDIAPGADTVQFIAAPGYQFSTASSDPVTVTSGSAAVVNAGEYAGGTISGTVFDDLNADGIQDGGDTGLGGQTVELLGANGQTIATTSTGAGGAYTFAGVNPGYDTVQFIASPGDGFSTASSDPVTVTSGGTATFNAGEVAPSTISGTVFLDENADGIQESGDSGIAGQTVTLLNAVGATLATTTTDGNGDYSFSGLAPGADTVAFTAEPGDTLSTAGAVPLTVTSGSANTANAGEYAPASLPVVVYVDANGDGVQDDGETGLSGVPVQLLNATGTAIVATATTDANGDADFTGLKPGTYEVTVTTPAGHAVTQASDIGTPITLTSGDPAPSAKEGIYEPAPGRIDGHVFVSTAGTGLYQQGDANVTGVTVELFDATKNTMVALAKTDGNGDFSFTNVAAGDMYYEKFVLPSGLSFTAQRVDSPADDAINSAPNSAGTTADFSVSGNQDVTDENAGVDLNGQSVSDPASVPAGEATSFNTGGYTIVGAGNDNIHTNAGSNLTLIGSAGSGNGNVFESGPDTDIVYSTDSLNAQALGSGTFTQAGALGFADYLFGGTGTNDLQGGAGSDYLMGGPGYNLIAGGSGPAEVVAGINSEGIGSVTRDASGNITGYTVNNEIRPGNSTSSIIYQKGDGVMLLDTFNTSQDSLTIYGYAAGTTGTLTTANGHTILDLGGNDAIVFNSVYNASSGGITFSTSSAPTLVLNFDANGMPYFTAAASAGTTGTQPTVAANGGATTVTSSAVDLASGGTANTVFLSGAGNTVSGADNDANNVLVFTGGATGSVTLGNGANAIMAYGGSGDVINAGTGDNTVFAQITDSTVTVGGGSVFVFGNNNAITVSGDTQTVVACGTNDTVLDSSSGSTSFLFAGGTDYFSAGSHAVYAFGAGVTVTSVASGSSNSFADFSGTANITLGNGGSQLIGLSGTSNTITIGNANATVFAGQGNDTVTLGTGDDTVVLGAGDKLSIGGGVNSLWVGLGNDTISLTGIGTNDVYFFGNGDTLDLSALVGSQTGVSAVATATNGGSDTLISLAGGGFGAGTLVADLHGVHQSVAGLGAALRL